MQMMSANLVVSKKISHKGKQGHTLQVILCAINGNGSNNQQRQGSQYSSNPTLSNVSKTQATIIYGSQVQRSTEEYLVDDVL
jgi:hypothetical protein